MFDYTAGSNDRTSDLEVTGVNLPSNTTVQDVNGINVDFSSALNVSTGISVNTSASAIQYISAGQTSSSISIGDGSLLEVLAGGTSLRTIVGAGGIEDVFGLDVSATINNDGQQVVFYGGTASASIVNDPSAQTLSSGGVAIGTRLSSGEQEVLFGATAVATLATAGGVEVVSAGGTASDFTIGRGGTGELSSAAIVHGLITFVQNGGTLEIAGSGGYLSSFMSGLTVSGLAGGDVIDLTDVTFSPAELHSFPVAASL